MSTGKKTFRKHTEDEWLRKSGSNLLDQRQRGWSLAFATFAVAEWDHSAAMAKLCSEMKDQFISRAKGMRFSSQLTQITFSPVLTKTMYPALRDFKIAHGRKEKYVHIWSRIDLKRWDSSTMRQRRRLLVMRLLAGIDLVRDTWLLDKDREALIEIFKSMLDQKNRHGTA